ncbi:MAG: hypothetical protein K6T30_02410, partial [Alicyclobacillus sp.]|nr:hypothetical protein [Alicyclobacillus sp.]
MDFVLNDRPTVAAGTTSANPQVVSPAGSNITELSAFFFDDDTGENDDSFVVSMAVRAPSGSTYLLVDAKHNGEDGLFITSFGGGNYRAAFNWDPTEGVPSGYYDLYFNVTDVYGGSSTDNFANNTDELML